MYWDWNNMIKDNKGQKQLEDFDRGVLPALEGLRLESASSASATAALSRWGAVGAPQMF